MEIWKPIVGYETFYSVSSLGRIRNEKARQGTWVGRILKTPHCPTTGYPMVYLHCNNIGKNVTVHSIVAEAFLGKRPEKYEVNHINGKRHDNNIKNLEYVTKSQQALHSHRVLGVPNGRAKLTKNQVIEIRRIFKEEHPTHQQLAERYGIVRSAITNIINNKSWKF